MSKASTSLIATPSKTVSNLFANALRPSPPPMVVPPSPGTFRHPQLTEIIKRQSASSLSSQKVQNAMINAAAVGSTFVMNNLFQDTINKALGMASIPPTTFDASAILFLVRLLFLANIVLCLRPVLPYMSQKDDIVDIPLTPSQRSLLGLAPSNAASPASASASTGFVTPPRYRRDGGTNSSASARSTPLGMSTGRRSISANYTPSSMGTSRQNTGASPPYQSNQGQPARASRFASDSPLAGSSIVSPMLHRATNADFNQSTFTTMDGRASLGASTSSFGFGLSRSQSVRERRGGFDDTENTPGTPSPSGPKRQPGVNYKWLYDKGARLPRSESTGF